MGDFHPLTVGGEQDRVIADDISGANGGEADGVTITFAGLPLPCVNRDLAEVASERVRDHLAHAEGGAATLWR